MHSSHTYNATVDRLLRGYLSAEDYQGLLAYLGRLTSSQFRSAGAMMAETILPAQEEEVYWHAFDQLYHESPKAWLGTLLKAAAERYSHGKLRLDNPIFISLCEEMAQKKREIDEVKVQRALLPLLRQPEEVADLLRWLGVDMPRCIVSVLLPIATLPSRYVLFQQLRRLDHEPELLTRCCTALMQHGGDQDFNLVSIIRNYFDLPAVKGVFSLRLNPYQLSRLETNYEDFCKIITSI